MNTIKVRNHIDVDHREFAAYDNHRNIAHIADGLKPSQRKVIHTVIETLKGNSEIKVANIGSRASDFCHYQHGEDSIIDTVIGLAQDFPGSNNLPMLQREGQFGNMMDNEASEPRYIYIKPHKNLDRILDPHDRPILPEQFYDGERIEPKFFLPKLPMLLVNGSRGVGNGYSSRILPRSVGNVKKAIKLCLDGKPIPDELLMPSYNGFTGSVVRVGKQYQVKGVYEKAGRTKLRIKDLPPDSTFQYENYKNRVLLKLLDTKQIRNFEDSSTESQWNIEIDAPMDFVNLEAAKLDVKLGITLNVTETLNCWGWDGKLMMFDTPQEMLEYWVAGRLEWLEKRRLSMIKVNTDESDWLKTKLAFIEWWNVWSPSLIKMKKPELVEAIKKAGNITQLDDHISRLLSLRVTSLTVDEIDDLKAEIEAKETEIKKLNSTTPRDMLKEDISKA